MATRRRIVAGLALALTGLSLPLACNSITGASGYSTQTCDECLVSRCAGVLNACDQDARCSAYRRCLAGCDQGSSDVRACFAQCAADSGANPARVTTVEACAASQCAAYCVGAEGSDASVVDGADVNDAADVNDVADSPTDSADDTTVTVTDSGTDSDVGGVAPGPKVLPPDCDSKGRGPTMAKITTVAGDYCIDTTEVTAAQYYAFWKEAGDGRLVGGQTPACNFNSDYTPQYPSSGWADPLPSGLTDQPVRYVDWCDANQFCRWAGKRLCGAIGTPAPITYKSADENDASKDQWFAACSNGGTTVYPYGGAYVSGNCNEANLGGSPKDVGTSHACSGTATPYSDVFDMIGNVAEWEDSCESGFGSLVQCRTRGGNFATSPGGAATCAVSGVGTYGFRGNGNLAVGFRCCSTK